MPKSALDISTLVPIVEPIVRAHGGEIEGMEWLSEPGGWVLRVLVEKLGSAAAKAGTEDSAVSLELCSNVAKELSPALDVSELVGHRYSLEVSSPGIERVLRTPAHYERFAGKLVKVKFRGAVLPLPPKEGLKEGAKAPKGEKAVSGHLEAGDAEGAWRIVDGAKTYPFTLDDVAEARLVFEFGSKKTARKASHKSA